MPERRRPTTDEIYTEIYDPGSGRKVRPPESEETTEKTGPPEHAGVLNVISLKTPAELADEKRKRSARILKPKIRSLGEISGTHTPPQGLGFLAPPRDAEAARGRRTRSNTRWALVGLAIAVVVGVSIWVLSTH